MDGLVALEDVLTIEVGSRVFRPEEDWAGYIGDRLEQGFKDAVHPVDRAVAEHLKSVLKYVEHFHGRNPWNGQLVNPSNRLQRRSGKGIQSIRDSAKHDTGDDLGDISVSLGTGSMSIHEEGGVIRPSRAKYLTIPLPSACDRRGVPLKKSARDWPDTFVIRSKRGNLLIVQKNEDGGITPLYLLKSSVRIKARLGLEKTWTDYVDNRLERRIIDGIEKALNDVRF